MKLIAGSPPLRGAPPAWPGACLPAAMTLPLIDVHTHMFLPRYVALLRQRTKVPRIVSRAGGDRLVILPDEEADTSTSAGRPIGGEVHEGRPKLPFLDKHGHAG